MGIEFGERLYRLRLERGLTQQDLAGHRYTRQFVSAVELGQREPSGEAVSHFAGTLGIDSEDLLHGRPPGLPAELAESLDEARQRLCRGEVAEAAQTFADVESRAQRYHLPELEAYARYCRGEAELHAGGVRAALAHYERAEEIRAGAPLAARAPAIARRARCLVVMGELSQAVYVLENALAELRADAPDHPDPDAQVRLLTALAEPYFEMGSPDRAVAAVDEALALAPKVRNPEWIARLQLTAGRAHFHKNQAGPWEEALAAARKIYEDLGFDTDVARSQWCRGYLLARAGRLAEAAEDLSAARAVLATTGASSELDGPTNELADVLRRQGRLDEAAGLAAESVEIATRAGHVEWLAEAIRLCGFIALDQGRHAEAESALRRALGMYERAGARIEVAVTCRSLGKLLIDGGDLKTGMEVYRRGLEFAELA